MISVEEKRAAYEEARQLLLLGKKWQQLMPGERKPDFERAAKAVIRRALGKTVVPREPDLDVHNGLMHEHAPLEARLIERTLRNGIVHPDVLHSFRHGEVPYPEQVPIGATPPAARPAGRAAPHCQHGRERPRAAGARRVLP